VLFVTFWRYGAYVARLTSQALTKGVRHPHTIAWTPAPFVIGALTLLEFVSRPLAVVGYVVVVLAYVLPIPRFVARWEQRRRT
jgi:hypothetical protein